MRGPSFPVRALWVWAIGLGTIALLAFVWYVAHIIYTGFAAVGHDLIYNLGTNSTRTETIEAFFSYADTYLLVLAALGVLLFVLVYSQRKGAPVYEY